MSDGGRWRRVYSLEWHAAAFQGLTDAERVVYFYAKTGPQSTSVGIYRVSTAVAVEDIGGNITPIEFDCRLDVVCGACEWRFDPPTRVLWMPNWLNENPPQSPNVCTSWRKLLVNLPDCDLKFEAAQSIAQHLKDLPEAFRKAFGSLPKDYRISKAKPLSKPEAYQGAGEQGIQGSGIRGTGFRAGSERKESNPTDGSVSQQPAVSWVRMAKETLELGISPTLPTDQQVDAFLNFHRVKLKHLKVQPTRTEIAEAFAAAARVIT